MLWSAGLRWRWREELLGLQLCNRTSFLRTLGLGFALLRNLITFVTLVCNDTR